VGGDFVNKENVILVMPDGRTLERWVGPHVNSIHIPVFERYATEDELIADGCPALFGALVLSDQGVRDQGRRVFS
jgi:hypothetical protein